MIQTVNATIRSARSDELPTVLNLLKEVALPTEGVEEHFREFLVASDNGKVVGCIGQERYGEVALLRSLAVSPSRRRNGLGKELTARLLDAAKAAGVSEVVLLTTTAKEFFAHQFGFAEAARSDFDNAFANSPEWHLPRCSTAVCMRLRLYERAKS